MATTFTKIDRSNLSIDFAHYVTREDFKRRQRGLKQHHYAITFTYRVVPPLPLEPSATKVKRRALSFNW